MTAVIDREQTIRETVVQDFRTAAVFQKYGLDFCCGGGVSIETACRKKGVDVDELVADLTRGSIEGSVDLPRFSAWSDTLLVDYIENNHHNWVRSVLPVITQHATKVARVHGEHRPSLKQVDLKVQRLAVELLEHMEREESELFPLIRSLVNAPSDQRSEIREKITSLIEELESDHDGAGEMMREVRELTDGYLPPADACMTYKVLFNELEEFERDLHTHVHLENNLLFPRYDVDAVESLS